MKTSRIVPSFTQRYNKRINILLGIVTFPKPSMIMCCSPNREAVRAATDYNTRAWQTLIYAKECYIVIVIYLPFNHEQSQIILFICLQKMSTVTSWSVQRIHTGYAAIKKVNIIDKRKPKIVKTEFSIAISILTGNNLQSKTLVAAISDPRSPIVRQEFSIATSSMETILFSTGTWKM